jgi:hypothetical protein
VPKRNKSRATAGISPPATSTCEVAACAPEERLEELENPEIAAMSAISELLRRLPDDGARLRVMRWSFGRFSDEFKRPVPEAARSTVAAPAGVQAEREPGPPPPAPARRRPETASGPASLAPAGARPEAAPGPAPLAPAGQAEPAVLAAGRAGDGRAVENEDFACQLSELNDLFEPLPVLSDDPFF